MKINKKFDDRISSNSEMNYVGKHTENYSPTQVPSTPTAKQGTPYDYLSLLPVIIIAATPLILGLNRKEK